MPFDGSMGVFRAKVVSAIKKQNKKRGDELLKAILAVDKLGDIASESQDLMHELRALIELHLSKSNSAIVKEIKALYEAGAPLTGEDGIRRMLGAVDMEFFGRAYFPHYFSLPSPDFHKELDDIWHKGILKNQAPLTLKTIKTIGKADGSRRAVAAPRGHAKSTSLTFKGSMHASLYEYKHYLIIVSDSSEQAEGFLENIKIEFEDNPFIAEDFGLLVGKVWRGNVLLTRSNVKIEALGSGKKIRGRKHRHYRPDLIILDDIENDENIRTPEQRKKLENWFFKAVSKAGDYYTDIIIIGTLLHYDSLLAKCLKTPNYQSIKYKAVARFSSDIAHWDEWEKIYTDLSNPERERDALAYFEAHKAEMLEGTSVLWEEKNSYYKLMTIKVSDGDSSFNSELQNEPINPEDCIFNEEWFEFYNEAEIDFKDPVFDFFGFVDPSLGKTKKSDPSAIITLAKNRSTGYMYVVDADIMRRHPDKIITDILSKARFLKTFYGRGYKKFGAETNQFQWFLKEEIAKASAKAGIYLPLEEVNQNTDKTMRIQTLQPDIKNKYILFNKRHRTLLEQLYHFPMGAHDDGPDALQGALAIAKKSKRFRILNRLQIGL